MDSSEENLRSRTSYLNEQKVSDIKRLLRVGVLEEGTSREGGSRGLILASSPGVWKAVLGWAWL